MQQGYIANSMTKVASSMYFYNFAGFLLVFTLGQRYTAGTFNSPEINVDNDGCSRHTTASAA